MRTTENGRPMHVVVLGGGPIGTTAALLLAGEGHRVTLLDKDSGGPGSDAEQAWDQWRRPGVNQFRHPHLLLPGGYQVLSRELPDALAELRALGARPHNMLDAAFDLAAIGGRKPGDERFDTLAARRPIIEQGLGNAAVRAGVSVRRDTAIAGFLTEAVAAIPHITGVRTAQGEEIHADLVIDAMGRNSPASKMLTDVGAVTPVLDKHETGFLAYSRYFRSADGSYPAQAAWPLEHHDSLGLTTVPGDAGTWALALFVSVKDRAMRALSDPEVWQRVAALYPGMAHWASHGEPITGVLAMSGMEARHRSFVVDGKPVATGLLSIGDAWATTNPTFGFGLTMGMSHSLLLRDVVREVGFDDREKLALRFDEITNSILGPAQQASASWDLHRLAQIDLEIEAIPYQNGVTYRTEDPDWNLRQVVEAAKLRDPDVLRAFGDIGSGLSSPEEALARPGVLDRISELGGGAMGYPQPGPSRAELLAVIGAK
ncbi:NAD(P)/FAD-dependent oxidoreductase [Nocardia lijiangensis]|uniref:NAD(P)/FAD-dependent oxidoreductase n=1 Tax=Nocardia lijiangensis TaxID=299618 RepID=UPI000A001280|nr:FAD-dependent oxidoreductase [Nocardia lijiangensis]